jgi:hypothetical protein
MTAQWPLREVVASDTQQVGAYGCFRDDEAAWRPRHAAWVGPRIESGNRIGLLAVEGDLVVGGAGVVLLDRRLPSRKSAASIATGSEYSET